MEHIKLSPRLQAVAALVPEGSSVADVGTDHGYIPVWLALSGRYGAIAATDINEGPLQNARSSACAYGVEKQISFIRCSGLDFPESGEYRTVILAGMGGELIAAILEAAPWTVKDTTLILQPNSKIDVLNAWLLEHGCHVTDAKLVKDGGKLYQILLVDDEGHVCPHTPGQRLIHPLYFHNKDSLLPEYLDGLIEKYTAAVMGMRKGRQPSEELAQTEALLEELKSMRKETETW